MSQSLTARQANLCAMARILCWSTRRPASTVGIFYSWPISSQCGLIWFPDIYGQLKNVRKSDSYQVHGPGNLIGIRDKKDYAKKKKIFQQGFSDTALRRHEPKVLREIDTFCSKMVEDAPAGGWSSAWDMNRWCKRTIAPGITESRV